jgi:hypothetical protein
MLLVLLSNTKTLTDLQVDKIMTKLQSTRISTSASLMIIHFILIIKAQFSS